MDVDIFIPCFIDQLFPETGFHMVKVLEKAGCRVHYNPAQTCCGQPAFNAGFQHECRPVAEKFIRDFNNGRPVVIPSASCSGFVKNYYGQMLENSSVHNDWKSVRSQVYEFSDFLVNRLKVVDFNAALEGRATYHDSCSGLREIGIKSEPRVLLAHVRGLELAEMKKTEDCCGFGGTFAVKYEPISASMGLQKVKHAIDTGADYLISTDLSCLLHLQALLQKQKSNIKIMHLADVLASGW